QTITWAQWSKETLIDLIREATIDAPPTVDRATGLEVAAWRILDPGVNDLITDLRASALFIGGLGSLFGRIDFNAPFSYTASSIVVPSLATPAPPPPPAPAPPPEGD